MTTSTVTLSTVLGVLFVLFLYLVRAYARLVERIARLEEWQRVIDAARDPRIW